MKLPHTLLALAVSSVLLTACDKQPTETKTDTKTETTAPTKKDTPANPAILSPYLDFQVTANRGIVSNLLAEQYPNLTDVQKACIASTDGNTNYVSVLEPYFKGILTDAEIKEADEFLATSAGEKFKEMMYTAFGVTQAPSIPPTAEEQKALAKAMFMPFVVKVKAKTDAMSEEEALTFMGQIVDKEKARCNIS